MPGGPPVFGGISGLLCDVRGDAGLPQFRDETGAVVSVVSAQGKLPR